MVELSILDHIFIIIIIGNMSESDPADSSTTTPDPPKTGQFNSSALGGALGGCVFLLLIMAVTVGVVIIVIRSKKYIGVQENRAYHNRNPTYQPEGGEHINLLTIANDVR